MDLDPKDPDVPATYTIDWHDQLITPAWRRYEFAQGAVVFFPRDTGFYYECTTAGRTSANYPYELPVSSGETFADGSVTWTTRHPDAVSTADVQSVSWTVPAGLTQDSASIDGTKAHITLSGGTDGVDYEVLCRMTPSSGNVIEKTLTIQVRAQ